MQVGDLVKIYDHWKFEGSLAVVTKVTGATFGVRTRYTVKMPCGHATWFYSNQLVGVTCK